MNYRQIYEEYYGPIPIDEEGRTYDIHHKDGNRENNDIDNLIALSIQEHYDVHFEQKDWYACLLIADRMKKTLEELSKLASEIAKQRVIDGTNPFLGGEIQKRSALKRVKEGTHPFTNSELHRKWCKKHLEEGTHNFLDREKAKERAKRRVENGTHPFLGSNRKEYICPCCGKKGKSGSMKLYHFDNCEFGVMS